jgi:ADP-ribosyl-[dinitrogen reductase] hydrolase
MVAIVVAASRRSDQVKLVVVNGKYRYVDFQDHLLLYMCEVAIRLMATSPRRQYRRARRRDDATGLGAPRKATHCKQLLSHDGFDAEAMGVAYAGWFHGWTHDGRPEACGHAGCRPFDIGGTTRRALSAVRSADVVSGRASSTSNAAADPDSQANGALMRVSPLGIWGWQLPLQQLADAARADARLTHPNPVCQEASAAFVVAVAQAIREGGSRERVYQQACDWAHANCREQAVIDALEAAGSRPPRDYMHQQGWVLTALQNAFFQLLHAPSFEEAVVRTVQSGGDTDTNAAICGALVGSVYGREAVPAQWRRMVTTCRPFQGQLGVHHPRPALFWPTDVLVLAERLLIAGRRSRV